MGSIEITELKIKYIFKINKNITILLFKNLKSLKIYKKNKNKTLTIKILINEIAGPKIIDSGIIEKNINKLFSKYLFSM